jgi:hypothetical protein
MERDRDTLEELVHSRQQGLRIGCGGFHSGVSMINHNAICEEVLVRGHDKVVLNHKRSLLTVDGSPSRN